MEVTKATIYPMKKKVNNLVAFVDLTFNDALVCKGFKIVDGKKGLFVSKPSSKGADDKYYDQVYILDKDYWDEVEEYIIEQYEEAE